MLLDMSKINERSKVEGKNILIIIVVAVVFGAGGFLGGVSYQKASCLLLQEVEISMLIEATIIVELTV